jgi:hypothetical protein
MIYDFPETSSPIGQGDIFFGIPILDLTDEELPTVDDEGNAQALPWEAFASDGKDVSAIVTVRPTIAIVGTQECDALRAPNITLFEVRPFRDIERKSKDTSKPSKWVPLITQHARINQKWFYLPADERLGFTEKMGADFLTPIRIPRLAFERLRSFRKGRLNEIAKQHFRERLAEFFRRYAYDEWYPLTREELAEYQKTHTDAEPFPWQREDWIPENESGNSRSDYVAEWDAVIAEVRDVLSQILSEFEALAAKYKGHTTSLQQSDNHPDKVASLMASDMDDFSTRVDVVLPKFNEAIERLERSYSAYISSANLASSRDVGEISNSRNYLSETLKLTKSGKETVIESRDFILSVKDSNIGEELTRAANRQSQVLDDVISNMEELESFALKMIFLINEKFGESSISEDKTE